MKRTTYPVIVLHAGRWESATILLLKPQKAMNAHQFKGEEGLFFLNKVKTRVCIFYVTYTKQILYLKKKKLEEYKTVQC